MSLHRHVFTPLAALCALLVVVAAAPPRAFGLESDPVDAQLLVLSAHPDDEGIFGGATLAHYAQSRDLAVVHMTLVTRSENGRTPLGALSGEDRNTELRHAIDRYAGVELGGGSLNTVGHYVAGNITLIEGGFVDQARPRDAPPSYGWGRWGTNTVVTEETPGYGNTLGEADGRRAATIVVAREIRRYRPEVVVAVHDLEGDYGHTAHTATAIAAIEGAELAADASIDIDGLPSWTVAKVYLRGDQNDNRASISWDGFRSDGGIHSLFHDYWELAIIEGAKAREIADYGVKQHLSQPRDSDVSSVYQPIEWFEGHHSEWWTLYRSNVGMDTLRNFTLAGTDYVGWARGEFFENTGIALGSFPEEPPVPRAMSAWSFDEGSGSVAEDRVGPYDGLIMGAEWVPGVRGTALRFDDVDGDVVVFDGFDLDSDWSAALWVRQESITGSALLLSTNRSALKLEQGATLGYTLYYHYDDAFSISAPLGDWTHLTFVRAGTTMSVYVDCVLADSRTSDPSRTIPLPRDRLGRRINGADGLVGSVDELVLWRGALSSAQIGRLCGSPGDFVMLDVKPGSAENPVNVESSGVIPVAVLGSYTLDVRLIDSSSLLLGTAALAHSPDHAPEDVNNDGFPDLVGHFRVRDTGIARGDVEVCLSGRLADGTAFSACDTVDTDPGT